MPSSLEPAWTDPEERFVVAVGLEKAARSDLTLEVWDEDNLGKGDFLGQVSARMDRPWSGTAGLAPGWREVAFTA